jgi:hypothetical protein
MPVAKTKKISKTTKKVRSTKPVHHGLSMKKIAAIVFIPLFAIVALAVGLKVSYATTQTVTYNSITTPLSEDVPQISFESRHIAEFGSQVKLAGTDRMNANVTILMSSMACESGTFESGCTSTPGHTFNHPVTLRVYNVDNTKPDGIGDLFTSVEKTFAMPFRPSSGTCGSSSTMWADADGVCHSAKSFTIDFSLAGKTLPDNVIVTVGYNTTHEGLEPIGGTGGYYDYLAVGGTSGPSVGESLPGAGDAYVSYSPEGTYADGLAGTKTLRLDPYGFYWFGSILGLRISSDSATTTPPPVVVPPAPDKPKTADDCKKDNWKIYTPAFKNQGQCVSSVVPQ